MTTRAELYPTAAEIERLRLVASGRAPADLIIRGGRVLASATNEFLERDVVIAGRHIAAITPVCHFEAMDGCVEVDATGKWVVPTFIDAHLHIEYTMLSPGQLARLSVPRGTTTVLTDPNGAANFGEAAMDYLLTTSTPLKIFQQVSPTTPASTRLERGGVVISDAAVLRRLCRDDTVTLGESNPFDHSLEAAQRYAAALASGRRITGHTAAQSGEELWGYLAAGVGDDHNAVTIDEVLERVRLGALVTIMGSSLTDNTIEIFSDLERIAPAFGSLAFCADDKHVLDLEAQGHIDHHVRQAIRFGVPPAWAYRMATQQPAAHYRLDQVLGILAPSHLADLQIIDDLATVRPSSVYVAGREVARDGIPLFEVHDAAPEWSLGSFRVPADFDGSRFRVDAPGPRATVRAVEMYNGYFKRAFAADLEVRDGNVVSSPEHDILKIAVVDRHHGDGLMGVGFVRGFGLSSGAIASFACMNVNIVVVGTTDDEMAHAVRALREAQGGFVAVDRGAVLGAVELPLGGMMSDAPWEDTADALSRIHEVVSRMGCSIVSPFMILSFVGLAGVPELGLTERGLIDSKSQEFVDLIIEGAHNE